MKCEHSWRIKDKGFYFGDAEQYEVYYCINCLANVTIEYPDGKRTLVEIEELEEKEVNSLEIKDIRQKESLSELGENPNANIHSQINNEIGKDYVRNSDETGKEKGK